MFSLFSLFSLFMFRLAWLRTLCREDTLRIRRGQKLLVRAGTVPPNSCFNGQSIGHRPFTLLCLHLLTVPDCTCKRVKSRLSLVAGASCLPVFTLIFQHIVTAPPKSCCEALNSFDIDSQQASTGINKQLHGPSRILVLLQLKMTLLQSAVCL